MAFNRRSLMAFLAAAAAASVVAPVAIAQPVPDKGGSRKLFEDLNLSSAQQTQVDAIHAEHREQMGAIFTEDQRAQLDAAREAGERRPFKSLDLTDAQKDELRSLHESTRDRVSAVLTDEQRQQLEAKRAERGPRPGGGSRQLFEDLDLTSEQQAQVDAIQTEHREKMATIFTEDQRQQVDAARESGERPRSFHSLDLSDDQKAELQSLHESTRDRISAVLTDEQREQLEAKREAFKSRRGARAF